MSPDRPPEWAGRLHNAVEAGVDLAVEFVAGMPPGQKAWDVKEYGIAEVAARAAVLHFIATGQKPTAE